METVLAKVKPGQTISFKEWPCRLAYETKMGVKSETVLLKPGDLVEIPKALYDTNKHAFEMVNVPVPEKPAGRGRAAAKAAPQPEPEPAKPEAEKEPETSETDVEFTKRDMLNSMPPAELRVACEKATPPIKWTPADKKKDLVEKLMAGS